MSAVVDRIVAALEVGGRAAGDGCEWAAAVEELTPLRAVASWGAAGWDLGRWPLVVLAVGEVDGVHLIATYVEGDVAVDRYGTLVDAYAAVDAAALWWWRAEGHGPDVTGVADVDALPSELRGPFAWSRADAAPL